MNKHAAQIKDALDWEAARGFGPKTLQESKDSVTLADGTRVKLKGGRIEVTRTPEAEALLQEAIKELHEQQPTSYAKQPEPQEDATFHGLDLSAYTHFKAEAKRKPIVTVNTPSAKTLSEAQLDEARASLYHSTAGVAAHKQLPDGIHARLARAVRGY